MMGRDLTNTTRKTRRREPARAPETRCWTATSFPKFALESGLTPCSADNGTGAGISGDTALAPR
jgi:hypothetical protein